LKSTLEIVGDEVMTEDVRTGTHSDSWRERVPDITKSMENKCVFSFYVC